jgi:hypothetical protein
MRQPPWRWRRTAHRYNPAMTTFMNAALPANAALATVADTSRRSTSLPAGLTESDAARITAAISAARTESTRHVYALVWAQWERWCRSRGIPALPGDPLALYAYLTERAEAGKATGSTWPVPPSDTCTAWPAPRTLSPPRLSGRYAAGSCAPTARRPADWLARSPSTRSDRSFPGSTAPRRSGSATPRSSCSATPPRCVALRSWGSTSLTSNTSPLDSCSPSASRRGSGWSWSDGRRRSRTVRTHRPGGRGQCLASSAGPDPRRPLHSHMVQLGQPRTAIATCPSPHAPRPAVAAGLDGTRITAHSLRAGHATAAAMAGVPLDRIAAQTRHKDLTVLVNRYIRPLEALATTSSRDLGL